MIIPIRVMSDYTLLKSLIKISPLMTYLKNNNITACGICDENLFGVMDFYDACMSNNIKPIIGLKVLYKDVYLLLYAKNYQGYQNLLKIHTVKEKNEDISLINKDLFNHLLVVMEAKDINYYDEIIINFSKEDFYVGYKNTVEKTNAYLKTNNVLYAPELKAFNMDETKSLDLLRAIMLNVELKTLEKGNYLYEHFECLKEQSKEEMDNTNRFASLCNVLIPKNNRYIPHYDERITDSYAYLVALTKKGLQKRLNNQVQEEYVNRLKYELSVIKKMDFVDYFLIVYDYVKYAKQNNILVGLGRGSAAGSLVSYTLGITNVDPIKYNLLFERFLNPERVTMPDIDVDFEEEHRMDVVNYVKKRYGIDKVANIMTFGTLKCKLVVRSVCKALGVDNNLVNDFVNLLNANISLQDNLNMKKVTNFLNMNPALKPVILESLKLEGLKKHISTHAAGVVISSISLDEVIPIYYNGLEMLTGLTMNYLEEIGLLKMDFLVITNLDIIANVLKLIKEHTGKILDLNKIDYNDPLVMEVFQNADTVGVFQFESEGMKSFLKRLKPSSLDDIVMALAMYRPGPMENIDTFIKRKIGSEPITYLVPALEPILKETYGIIVYQEQIMQILVTIANYSYAEADIIRRAMSKKKKEVMESGRSDFIKKASLNGYDENIAKEIYDLILKFANYGFNKSHSVSYSMICVQMAYLKRYYPAYFVSNLLNHSLDSITKTKEYITLAKKYGILLLAPSINASTNEYKITNNNLRIPLTLIKNLGTEAARTILKERENGLYKDYLDFVSRTYGKSVNRKTYEALIMAGALDEFKLNHKTMLENLDVALNYASLSSELDKEFVLKPVIEMKSDLTKEEKRREELESFGFYINNHPASKYQSNRILKLENIKEAFDKYVTCIVLIESIRKVKTKKNEEMAFITGSDETLSGDFVIFPSTFQKYGNIKEDDLVMVFGRVTKRFSDYQINVNKIEKLKEK